MALGPRLPENAPFTPSQRAWLDGYIAGWFTFDVDMANERSLPHSPRAEPVETEDLPWHDPTLSLEERIALAEGRQPDRVLMAAMAQLDCGQCGYLCQTYAEAIARGEEKSLTRCAPGGKATSRKLKELIASGLDAKATTLPATAASTPSRTPPSPSDKPFVAIFRGADCLNGPQSEKETRHVILASEDSPADYEVGDSLGVLARNSAELVTAIIERLGAKPDTPVPSPDGIERPLIEALSEACEIRRPSDQAIEVLASRALDRDESVVLQAMAEGYPGAGPEDADLLDLLEAFPSTRPPLSELISALDPLQPRLYSIASSPKHVRGEVHLAVAAVRDGAVHGAVTELPRRFSPTASSSVIRYRSLSARRMVFACRLRPIRRSSWSGPAPASRPSAPFCRIGELSAHAGAIGCSSVTRAAAAISCSRRN
jgi:sulfite reductase (NADPH) flavoprotein alpha-component